MSTKKMSTRTAAVRHIACSFRTGEAAEGETSRTGLWGTYMFKEVLVEECGLQSCQNTTSWTLERMN